MSRRHLQKQHSWAPDILRDETWSRRIRRHNRCRSVTDDDVADVKACFELGYFSLDSPQVVLDPKLSDTFPALNLLNRTMSMSSLESAGASSCEGSSPISIFESGDDPEVKKARLKQWAQVVASAARQQSAKSK